MKRTIFTLFVLLFSYSLFATTFTVNGIAYSIVTGKTVAVTSSGTYTGSITIPSNVTYGGTTYSVSSVADRAFYNCTGLTSITIPSSITSIGSSAFYDCTGLTSIIIPSSVTLIGSEAFSNCTGLTSITIPSSVTTIGSEAFSNCSSLTTATTPYSCDSSSELYVGNIFNSCDKLTSIIIPNGLSAIKDRAFYQLTTMSTITIPSSVTSIGCQAFDGCSHLISLNIPSTITSIGNRATVDCYAIVDPSNPNYTSEDGVLYDKGKTTLLSSPISKVGSFIIPSSVTSINDEAFMNCTGLTSINIPSNLSSMGSSAFCGCSGLKSINIPTVITYLGRNTFTGCSGLTTITIPSNISSIGDSVFQWCKGLTSIYACRPIPVHFPTYSDVFDGVSKYCILYVPKGSIDAYWSASQWKDFVTIVEMTTALPTLKDENISLYPSLVTDVFHITGLTHTANLQLLDLKGRIVMSKQVVNNESVSTVSLPKGSYIVKIKATDGMFETKLIKK